MSAVSNRAMPRSIALWITLREASRSVRWPKLLQPRPTAETRRPEPPRLRICMDGPVGKAASRDCIGTREGDGRKARRLARNETQVKKMRSRSDAATDGDRWGRMIRDGGLIRRRRKLAAGYYRTVTPGLSH